MEKVAETPASASATMKAASLTDVAERRIAFGPERPVTPTGSVTAGISSVTAGVADVVTMIASALRRIRPDTSHVFKPATGPHPVPTPLAPEFHRAGGHSSIGLGAQPGQRLPVIEWMGRNGFGHDEPLPSCLAGATREGRRPAARSEERPQRAGKEEPPVGAP